MDDKWMHDEIGKIMYQLGKSPVFVGNEQNWCVIAEIIKNVDKYSLYYVATSAFNYGVMVGKRLERAKNSYKR